MIKRLGFLRSLLVFVLFTVFVAGVSGAIFFWQSRTVLKTSMDTSEKGIATLMMKSSIIKSLALVQSNAFTLMTDADQDSREIRWELIQGFNDEVKGLVSKCAENCQDIKQVLNDYQSFLAKLKTQIDGKKSIPELTQVIVGELTPSAEKVFDALDKELGATEKATKADLEVVQNSSNRKMMILLGVIAASVLAMLITGIWFKRILSTNLSHLAHKLSLNVEETENASNLVTTASAQLEESASTQSAAVQETAASLDEINSMVMNNADRSTHAKQYSDKTFEAASNGKQTVDQMIQVIDEINQGNQSIAQEIDRGNQEFSEIIRVISEIGEKARVINDIVFQTRLLSFNASVEAARAGEHGKGFAVVAEEVGKLAQSSGEAANEITSMLSASKTKVEEIISKTQSSMNNMVSISRSRAEKGTQVAHLCGEALDSIMQNVEGLKELIDQVATASKEQATGVDEVRKAMHNIDTSTQTNYALTSELKNAAGKMQNEASALKIMTEDLDVLIKGTWQGNSEQNKNSSHYSSAGGGSFGSGSNAA